MIDEQTRPMAAALHVKHCDAHDKHEPDHVCQGVITINAKMCDFNCAKCGSEVANIQQQVADMRFQELVERDRLEQWNAEQRARVEAAIEKEGWL